MTIFQNPHCIPPHSLKKEERRNMKSIKKKPIFINALILTFTLSACGSKAVPTVDPAEVQASAVAAANTIVAMTQAAMPTDTPIPPTVAVTDTPQATPTIPPLPTSAVLVSPTVAASSSSDDCQYLTVSHGEKMAHILVRNKTNELIGISFYLKKNAFGDCGYWSSQINPTSSIDITNLPTGCYYVGTWTLSGKPDFQNYGYPFCDTLADKFEINATVDTISFNPY